MSTDDSEPGLKISRGKSLVIPFGLLATVVGFLLFSGWKANAFLTEIQSETAACRAAVESLRGEMKSEASTRWTKNDMERWAYQLERINRDTKLNVPDPRMGQTGT